MAANLFLRTMFLDGTFETLAPQRTVMTVTLLANAENIAPVQLRTTAAPGSVVELSAGMSVVLQGVDLFEIEAAGTSGDRLSMVAYSR